MTHRTTAAIEPAGGATGLLVSVRNAAEAAEALAGGADVIDIKEPTHGALGAPTVATVQSVIREVAGRRPVTVALGELIDDPELSVASRGVCVVKIGLAGACAMDWEHRFTELRRRSPPGVELALAAYSEEAAAESPLVEDVLSITIATGGRWLVLDTWDKSGPSSLRLLQPSRVETLIARGRQHGVQVVLAGRLSEADTELAARYGPALVGVRGAACRGGRSGCVDKRLVRSLAQRLVSCRIPG